MHWARHRGWVGARHLMPCTVGEADLERDRGGGGASGGAAGRTAQLLGPASIRERYLKDQ